MGLLVIFFLLTVFLLCMFSIPDEILPKTMIRKMQSGQGEVLIETKHRIEHVIHGSLDPPLVVFQSIKPFQWSASLDLRILLIWHDESLVIFRDWIRRQTFDISATHGCLSVSPDGTRAIVCQSDQIWQITQELESQSYRCEPTHLDRSISHPVHHVTLGDSILAIAGPTTNLFRISELVDGYEWFQEIPIAALLTVVHQQCLMLSDGFGLHTYYHQTTPQGTFEAMPITPLVPEMVAKNDLIAQGLNLKSKILTNLVERKLPWRLYLYSPHRLRAERRIKLQKRRKPRAKSRSRSPPPRQPLATIYERPPKPGKPKTLKSIESSAAS